jgi:hypothetical protein
MHFLYFVRVPTDEAESAAAAMDAATAILDDASFAVSSSYFLSAKADWYAVGGRWSGIFTEATPAGVRAAAKIERMVKREYPALTRGIREVFYGAQKEEGLRAAAVGRANDLYLDATGFPYERDPYRLKGYEDDAVTPTPALLAQLREKYGEAEVCLTSGGEIEGEERLANVADGELVGSWLVAIDYHC